MSVRLRVPCHVPSRFGIEMMELVDRTAKLILRLRSNAHFARGVKKAVDPANLSVA